MLYQRHPHLRLITVCQISELNAQARRKLLQGKDLFEGFYLRNIIKRLLLNRSVSDDTDANILRRMKLDYGSEDAKKLEVMLNKI